MKLIPFNIFNKVKHFASKWASVYHEDGINEGIRVKDSKIIVDFQQDLPGDHVKLQKIKRVPITRKSRVPVYRGYFLEKSKDDSKNFKLKQFMEDIKKWGSIDDENLKALIDLTYPMDLRKADVNIIFVTGSSDPLAVRIAEMLKVLYYPRCQIVDILKKYYGVDINDIVDWEKFERADAKTKDMIETYLNKFSANARRKRLRFEGYIKKSSGLQSGARNLLMPGHELDDFVIDVVKLKELEWVSGYADNPNIGMNFKVRHLPVYLIVDDTMVGGSTLRGIFDLFLDLIDKKAFAVDKGVSLDARIKGYCLFSYSSYKDHQV